MYISSHTAVLYFVGSWSNFVTSLYKSNESLRLSIAYVIRLRTLFVSSVFRYTHWQFTTVVDYYLIYCVKTFLTLWTWNKNGRNSKTLGKNNRKRHTHTVYTQPVRSKIIFFLWSSKLTWKAKSLLFRSEMFNNIDFYWRFLPEFPMYILSETRWRYHTPTEVRKIRLLLTYNRTDTCQNWPIGNH